MFWGTRSGCLRQRLAVIVGTGETAEIAAIADAGAGHEEADIGGLCLCGLRRDKRRRDKGYGGERDARGRNNSGEIVH